MNDDDGVEPPGVRTLALSPWPLVWIWVAAMAVLLIVYPGVRDAVSALLDLPNGERLTNPEEWAARAVLWLVLGVVPPVLAVGRGRFGCGELTLAPEHFDVHQIGLQAPIRVRWSDVGEFRLGAASRLRSRIAALNAYTDSAPARRAAAELSVPVTVRGLSLAAVVDLLNEYRTAALTRR